MRHRAPSSQNPYPVNQSRWRTSNGDTLASNQSSTALSRFVVVLTFLWMGSHALVAQENEATQTQALTQPQPQPQTQTQTSNCDFTLHSVDVEGLRRDRKKTEADAIALMLRDMDDCIVEQTAHANAGLQNAEAEAQQIYNLNRNFMPGARSNQPSQVGRTSQAGNNSSLSNSSTNNNTGSQFGNQGQGNSGSAGNNAVNNAANNMRSQGQSIASKARSQFDRFASSVKNTAKGLGDRIEDSTEPQPQSRHQANSPIDPNQMNNALGSQLGKLEHTFDNYAKTLYEAYETETDPVLKNALLQELNNYVNTPEQ